MNRLILFIVFVVLSSCKTDGLNEVKTNKLTNDSNCELFKIFDEECFVTSKLFESSRKLIRISLKRRQLSTLILRIEQYDNQIQTTLKIIEPNDFSLFKIQNRNESFEYKCIKNLNSNFDLDSALDELEEVDSQPTLANMDLVFDRYVIEIVSGGRYEKKNFYNKLNDISLVNLEHFLDTIISEL